MAFILYYFNPDEYDITELNKILSVTVQASGVIDGVVYWGQQEDLPPFAVCADSDNQE